MNIVLQGEQGKTLTVAGDTIRIERQGLLLGKREKTIPIRNIGAVEVKQPGLFVGFIQFSVAGAQGRDASHVWTAGALDAIKDENAVAFSGNANYETALKVKAYVEAWSATSTADEIDRKSTRLN